MLDVVQHLNIAPQTPAAISLASVSSLSDGIVVLLVDVLLVDVLLVDVLLVDVFESPVSMDGVEVSPSSPQPAANASAVRATAVVNNTFCIVISLDVEDLRVGLRVWFGRLEQCRVHRDAC